jgi:signal transduction histidine kinase
VAHLEAAEGALSPFRMRPGVISSQARRTARENLVEARHLVAALRPEILEDSSLSGALERLAQR